MSSLKSNAFRRLVNALKQSKKTITVVEQSCGGLISSSIIAQPGASKVFWGGTVAYNTRKSKPILLNDAQLHRKLIETSKYDTKLDYIESKRFWTAETAKAYLEALDADYCLTEGGATGPTFQPPDLHAGFSVICLAGKTDQGIQVLSQTVIESLHADRSRNMLQFANAAAEMATSVIVKEHRIQEIQVEESHQPALLVLDRAVHLRTEPEVLADLERVAKYVVLSGDKILVEASAQDQLAMLQYANIIHMHGQRTFLGLLNDKHRTPIFSLDLPEKINLDGFDFADTRTSAPLFAPLQNELALHATAYAQWQRRSLYCTLCGSPTELEDGATSRICKSCSNKTWPRQDPSIIVAVSSRDGQRILLARSKRHPPKLHTVLAGFVEAGETFEAAVAREVYEETGICVDQGSCEYVGSQPWPFPQSCMIAFRATADCSQPLAIDKEEIVTAGWFSREQVLRAASVEGATMQAEVAKAALNADPSLDLLIPPRRVIARTLIDAWLGA